MLSHVSRRVLSGIYIDWTDKEQRQHKTLNTTYMAHASEFLPPGINMVKVLGKHWDHQPYMYILHLHDVFGRS